MGHLPAAHFTSIAFDLLTLARPLARRAALRRPAAGRRARVRLGGVSVHAVRLELEHERRDHAVLPRLGLLARLVTGGARRLGALSGWTKFASLLVVPLWLTYPGRKPSRALRGLRRRHARCVLDPPPRRRTRCTRRTSSGRRTVGFQIGRAAPWSLWDWGQYHARGLPDLHLVQRVLQGCSSRARSRAAFFPRRKSPLQLAALTAAFLAGFELVMTYWLYTYIPWFYPFAALALLAPALPLRQLVTVVRPGRGEVRWPRRAPRRCT